MATTSFDSGGIMARKLNTFLPLTRDEVKRLAGIQSQPLTVKRGLRDGTRQNHLVSDSV